MKQKLLFIFAIIGILFAIYRVVITAKEELPPKTLRTPAVSPFPLSVAASGIVEAIEENIKVQSQVAGLVKRIFVTHGQRVKIGMPIFHLDDSIQKALVEKLHAEVVAAEAVLREAEATLSHSQIEYQRKDALYKQQFISAQDYDDIIAKLSVAQARKEQAEASLKAKKAALSEAQTRLSLHTVRAPRDGTILQINVRIGEWVEPGQEEPPILMGRTDILQIRADIDELNAIEVKPGARAVAYIRGYTEKYIPLEFVRIEPYVVPKKQLTGVSQERVDVRVLQVIFKFKMPDFPVYPGQLVDVFIESSGMSEK